MGSKMDSILKLASLKLNTPDLMILSSREDVYSFIESKYRGWNKVSIRTDNKVGKAVYKKWGLPFYPNRTPKEAQKILGKQLLSLVDEEIDIIVSQGINPKNALLCGKYRKSYQEGDIMEYVLGPCTVRDVDKGIPKRWDISDMVMPTELSAILTRDLVTNVGSLPYIIRWAVARKFRVPFIVEFSVYPYGVGKLNRPLIFWEVIEEKIR